MDCNGAEAPVSGSPDTSTIPSSPAPPSNSGRSGNAGRGRRFNRRSLARDNYAPSSRRPSIRPFEGREPTLQGNIYDSTGERNPDQFIKTTKEIINYVGRTFTRYTGEFTQAVRDLHLDNPTKPDDPKTESMIAVELWKIEIKEYFVKTQEIANFRAGLYNVVLGQCTELLQDKLKSHPDFPAAYQDGIALLKIIKALTYTFEESCKVADALCDIK